MIAPPLCVGLLLVSASRSQAFTADVALRRQTNTRRPCTRRGPTTTSIFSSSPFGTGWDNDNFLDSLSSDEETIDWGDSSSAAATQSQPQSAEEQDYMYSHPTEQQQQTSWGADYSQQPMQQQVQKQEVGPLPLGWSAHFDPETRQLYYYNVNDGTTTWDKPASPPPPPPPPPPSGMTQYPSDRNSPAYSTAAGGAAALDQLPVAQLDEEDAEELPEGDIDGTELTEAMKQKFKASHTEEEEASGGGQKFKELMERAKKLQQQVGSKPYRPAVEPLATQVPPDLPVEEQARYIQEGMWRQQHPEIQERPEQAYLPSGIGIDGRKIGRNRDTEIISNTADVYFAQLKRDSTIRNLARYAGDDDKANEVFHDPSIDEFKPPEENPYLKEKRERDRNMVTTVPEEMLLFQEYDPAPEDEERSNTGVSYRDRLAQAKAKARKSSPPEN